MLCVQPVLWRASPELIFPAVFVPLWVEQVLKSPAALGLLFGGFAAGALLGNVIFTVLGPRLPQYGSFVIGAAVLGIANAILKPILTLLTLPLVILTLGLFMLVINIAMVALAEWVAPHFSIDGFWNYLGAVVIIWLVNWIAHAAIDRAEGSRRSLTA